MYMEKCTRCGQEFENYDQLRRHTSRLHKVDSHTFYVEHYLNGVWPTCKCGCGEKVGWGAENKKFCDYVRGHQARVHNNWGHNPKAIEKSSETRRQQFASGDRTVWNAGLTKEIDERVAANGIARAASITDDDRKMYSEQMRKNRLDGTIPTLYGDKASRWEGGVSSINQLARASNELYELWKYPILVRDKFRCTKCQATTEAGLHVHHDKETFSEIIKKVMTLSDSEKIDDFEVKKQVVAKVIKYHVDNSVSGVTLCKACHKELHPKLNFK